MNFNELYKKIYDLDKPVIAEGCGDMGEMGNMMGSDRQMPPAHPSMSVNLNAQGMDSIESLLRLMTKVNPDMISQKGPDMPALSADPSIAVITATDDKPEMLPVMTDPEAGGSKDIDGIELGGDDDMSKAQGDRDGDGDHDMRDHELETDYEDDDEKKEGAYDASTTPDPSYQDTDFMVNKLSGGLGKQQTMHKHSYKQGDNPMSVESIREGLANLYQQYKAK